VITNQTVRQASTPRPQSRTTSLAISSQLQAAPIAADLLPDVLDVDQGRDGADLDVLRAL